MPKRMEIRGRTPCVFGYSGNGIDNPVILVGGNIGEQLDADGQKLPPGPKDLFKVAFRADLQTPHIELSARVGGPTPGALDNDLIGRVLLQRRVPISAREWAALRDVPHSQQDRQTPSLDLDTVG
jgi:hypothetical protein